MEKILNLEKRQKYSIDNKYTYYIGGMAIRREEAERTAYNNDKLLNLFKQGIISEDEYNTNIISITYKNNETKEESVPFTSHEMFVKLDPLKNVVFNLSGGDINIQNALLEALLYCLKLDENEWNKGTILWDWYASDLHYYLYIDDGYSVTWHLREALKKINGAFETTIKEYEAMEMTEEIINNCAHVFGLTPKSEMLPKSRTDYDDEGSRAALLRNIANAQRFVIETYKYLMKECTGSVLDTCYCDKTKLREIGTRLFVLADEAQSCFDELSRAFVKIMEILPEKTEYRIREDEGWAQANKELEERDKEKTEIEEQ